MSITCVKSETFTGHKDRVWCVSWSPCGTAFASCSGDLSISIWKCVDSDIEEKIAKNPSTLNWKKTQILDGDHRKSIRCVAWSPTGKRIASSSFDKSVIIYELIDGDFEAVATLEGHESEVKWVAWNKAGDMLATCSRDKSIWVWHEDGDNEWECISVLTGHSQDVKQVRFFSDSLLISSSYDDTIKIWKEDEDDWYNEHTLSFHTSTVWSLGVDPNNEYIISGSDDKTIGLFRFDQKAFEASDSINNVWKKIDMIQHVHDRPIYSVDWSPSSHTYPRGVIVSGGGSNDIVFLLPITNEKGKIITLKSDTMVAAAHDNDINCVSFNPKFPSLLLTASDDKTVTLWNIA